MAAILRDVTKRFNEIKVLKERLAATKPAALQSAVPSTDEQKK
jgi:hypothetical protein